MRSWLNQNTGVVGFVAIFVAIAAWLFPQQAVSMPSWVSHLKWPQWPTVLFLIGIVLVAFDYFRLKRWCLWVPRPEKPFQSAYELVGQRIATAANDNTLPLITALEHRVNKIEQTINPPQVPPDAKT